MSKLNYSFHPITKCNMCGCKNDNFRILGQRLNSSQGKNPKKKSGISVSIMKCINCNLIFSNPRPVPHSFDDHYNINPEEYWKNEYFNIDENYFLHEIKKAKELLNFSSGMRALDIGGGIGKAHMALKNNGFETTSIEPSNTFRNLALSKFNIESDKYILSSIEDADFKENQFDFITFGAVLEHLNDPAFSILKSMKWLKKGGVIQIEVPSSKHLISKIYNLYFRLRGCNYITNLSPMHEPFHLYEFDTKSFKELSKKNNFSVAFYEYFVCSIYNIPKIFHPFLYYIMKNTNTGMQLSIWLRKD